MVKVALYARVSDPHQDPTKSRQDPENQLLELRDYCKTRGWNQSEFVDRMQGDRDNRPQLLDLLKQCRRRRFSAVVVWKFDRLGRSLRQLITLLDELHALGIQLISYRESIDTGTPHGRAMFGMIGIFAEYEHSLFCERTRAGMRRAKAEGKLCHRPKKILDLQAIRDLAAEGKSPRAIASILTSRGWRVSHHTIRRRLQQEAA
jgi:DNA invertase Pin-like site-specific DNA recombinase